MRAKRPPLKPLFNEFNRKFFDGKLPFYRVIRASLPGAMSGDCNWLSRTIRISSSLNGEDLRRTLLHEMCHHNRAGRHDGKRFLTNLRRLADMGERWAEDEIQACRKQSRPLISLIREMIQDEAQSEPNLPWKEVKKRIAYESALTLLELSKRAPWARRLWERERRKTLTQIQLIEKLKEKLRSEGKLESNCSD